MTEEQAITYMHLALPSSAERLGAALRDTVPQPPVLVRYSITESAEMV